MHKYVLIISQYYHSRHMYIVHRPDDFLDKAREFAIELMKHKRSADNTRPMYLGDLDPEYAGDGNKSRYNINDSGDIYFLQAKYANYLMEQSWEYRDISRRQAQGFKKKSELESIHRHHTEKHVYELVKKYFEIA